MSRPEGKWTKTPPGGECAFVYDRRELGRFVEAASKYHAELVAKAKELGVAPPPQEAYTYPRVAVRHVQDDGSAVWTISGSAAMWPEEMLLTSRKLVWWSRPVNIPRIPFLIAKEIASDDEKDLG